VFALAESPSQRGLLWAGTDDGLIHVTHDDGQTWRNVTPKDMPEWSMVSIIEPSPHDAGSAFAAIDRHNSTIQSAHLQDSRCRQELDSYRQRDTDGAYVRSVREDPGEKDCCMRDGLGFSVLRRRWTLATAAAESTGLADP